MTDTFGSRLRRERERRQIALCDIAERTKIKASLFEELERDDASHWPSGIFRRSFMRAYAEALGLDAEAVVREFLERFPDPAAVADDPAMRVDPTAARATQPAAAAPNPAAAVDSRTHHTLRLTLVETGMPFTGGRLLADARRRWSAAAWDLGSLAAVAISVYVFMDAFWMPFGVTALCYYVGGVLLLGNSPGVCLFAPTPNETATPEAGPRPARVPRHRHADAPPVRAQEPSYRTGRFRAERHRELRS